MTPENCCTAILEGRISRTMGFWPNLDDLPPDGRMLMVFAYQKRFLCLQGKHVQIFGCGLSGDRAMRGLPCTSKRSSTTQPRRRAAGGVCGPRRKPCGTGGRNGRRVIIAANVGPRGCSGGSGGGSAAAGGDRPEDPVVRGAFGWPTAGPAGVEQGMEDLACKAVPECRSVSGCGSPGGGQLKYIIPLLELGLGGCPGSLTSRQAR